MSKSLIPWKRKGQVPGRVSDADNPFELLHRQMNELFEGFFDDFGMTRWPALHRTDDAWLSLSPQFDVSETDDEVTVTAELPGMDEKDVEVTLENNVLTVKGEKKEEKEEKKRNYYLSERSYGQFRRVVPLPAGVDEEKIKARFKKGVLTVTLPKTEQSKKSGKTIEISAE